MKRLLRCKKGMTLVELVAGMMIFTVLAVSVSAILVPMMKVFVQANELAECNTLLDNLANEMVNDLSEATAPLDPPSITAADDSVMSVTIGSNTVRYFVDDDGVLQKGDGAGHFSVLTKAFYKKKSVSFFYTFVGSESESVYIYKLTVIISSDDRGEMVRREYAVRPIALINYKKDA